MQRIRTSWELGKISWSVLRSDKTLAAFPVFAAIAALVVFGVFGGLIALTGVNTNEGEESLEAMGYVFIAVGYVALAFVTTYFQAGLVSGANEVLDGRNATVRQSLDAATSKLHRILPWAILSATVSIIISAIEERAGFVGQIISSLLGAAWAVVTFLTIPVIMLEDLGPWNALKRSGTLLKQTWGENLAAQFGFGILGVVAAIPAIAVIAGGIATGSVVVAVVLGAVGVLWLIAVSVVLSAMNGIYRTALYRFTVDGAAPPAFADADLGHAFGHRKGRGRAV
ncbi:MAG TPA: DUF6159 family protein [Acidimicrobiia bacterium]|nr:DUF6159 family protein [Acidimicrobiia bacterium]